MKKRSRFKWLICSISALTLGIQLNKSQLMMPQEYKTIKTVVNELAKYNDLGQRPITFSIIVGTPITWNTEQLKLCKKDSCGFYKHLNPFIDYKGEMSHEINRAIQQSYVWGFDEATAYPRYNIITMSRSLFKHKPSESLIIKCIIGHELTHLFTANLAKNKLEINNSQNSDINQSEEIEHKLSRRNEIDADKGAAKLLFNAKYPIESCINVREKSLLEYLYPLKTDKNSHYPGTKEWMKELNSFLNNHENITNYNFRYGKTNYKWNYDKKRNTLTFIPTL